MSSNRKVCAVCGDKALGYNFNAITCESCKAFFRRNALSGKDFSCPFDKTCEITLVTRRFCQFCRLEKCFRIGMRKEYIMSEEDKIMKRKKIEQNRAKRKPQTPTDEFSDETLNKIKCEFNDSGMSGQASNDRSFECSSNDSVMRETITTTSATSENSVSSSMQFASEPYSPSFGYPTTSVQSPMELENVPTRESSANEIVSFIVSHPKEFEQVLSKLMPTQNDAMEILSKIIHSQKDAMRLIGHFIGAPGDALKIIGKVMNSTYGALTVFTKFMGSPNDALEFIAKCVNSPGEVLQLLQHLMVCPSDANETINQFLNSPAEAMKMLNEMVKTSMADSTTKPDVMPINLDEKSKENERKAQTSNVPPVDSVKPEIENRNTLESVIADAITIEYNSINRDTNINRELNDAENAKLNELIVAYKALFIPLDEDISPLLSNDNNLTGHMEKNPQDPQLLTLINLTAIAIRRMIQMVKKINAFKNMCQEDQLALLKGGCTEMMILRSIMQYDLDHSIWKIPNSQEIMSSIKSDILKLASNNVYEEYDNFVRSFDKRLRRDENIILIMNAIVLFTPTRTNTLHTDVISLEQNSYYFLLRRYLESIYAGCEAKSLFLKLIAKINDLQRLKDVIIAVYLDVNPNRVEPLIREIFDIKN